MTSLQFSISYCLLPIASTLFKNNQNTHPTFTNIVYICSGYLKTLTVYE